MEKLRQLFVNPELRKRILFTLVMLVIYRLGVHVSVPGVNAEALAKNIGKAGDLLNVVDLFSGGAFKKFSVFALGITPYITASIVLQLMGAVIPTLDNLQKKEGEAGREKINQWTRYLTVGLAFVQGFGVASLAQSLGPDVVTIPGIGFKFLCGFTLSVGSVFVMWLGEQITEYGVGNGISLLIFAGIVAGLPKAVETITTMFSASIKNQGNVAPPGVFILLLAAMTVVLLAVVLVESAYRNVPDPLCPAGGFVPHGQPAELVPAPEGQHRRRHARHLRQLRDLLPRHHRPVHQVGMAVQGLGLHQPPVPFLDLHPPLRGRGDLLLVLLHQHRLQPG